MKLYTGVFMKVGIPRGAAEFPAALDTSLALE
jgi:hypothetical protein